MVRIRLRRTGQKGQPSYRLIIADKESPRDGRFLEIVGFYNPRTEPATLKYQGRSGLRVDEQRSPTYGIGVTII